MLKFSNVEQEDFDELRRRVQEGIKEWKEKSVNDIKKWRKDFDAERIKNQKRSQSPKSFSQIAEVVSAAARAYQIAKGTTYQLVI